MRRKFIAVVAFQVLASSSPALATDAYISLDRRISKKCGITFKHPKHWNFFYVEPDNPDEVCIIAYRDLARKKEVSDRPVLRGWMEFAHGGLYVQKTPVNERLEEHFFQIGKNGVVAYVGEPLTEMAAQSGYTADTVDGMDVVKQGNGTLYVGYAHNTKTRTLNGKSITEQRKKIDLLFGDDSISVGERSVVSDKDKLRSQRNTIFENIFRSMRLTNAPKL